jgi:hypothetical protein
MPLLGKYPFPPSISIHVATIALVAALVSASAVSYDLSTIEARSLRLSTAQADLIAPASAAAIARDDRAAAEAALKPLRADPNVLAAGIFRNDGVAFFTYVRADPSHAAALSNAREGGGHEIVGGSLLLYRAISVGGEEVGSLRVLSAMDGVRASLLRHAAAAALIFVAVVAISLPLVSRLRARELEAAAGRPTGSVPEGHSVPVAPVVRENPERFNGVLSQIPGIALEAEEADAGDGGREEGATPAIEPTEAGQKAEPRAQLMEAVLGVVETLRVSAEARGVRLQVFVDPSAVAVAIEPQALQEILWNLLANAVEATAAGGRVQLAARRADTGVAITVSDGGAKDGPTQRLRAARRLIELHHGRLRIEPAASGQGALVTAELAVTAV